VSSMMADLGVALSCWSFSGCRRLTAGEAVIMW
jgi:hypothetical protein